MVLNPGRGEVSTITSRGIEPTDVQVALDELREMDSFLDSALHQSAAIPRDEDDHLRLRSLVSSALGRTSQATEILHLAARGQPDGVVHALSQEVDLESLRRATAHLRHAQDLLLAAGAPKVESYGPVIERCVRSLAMARAQLQQGRRQPPVAGAGPGFGFVAEVDTDVIDIRDTIPEHERMLRDLRDRAEDDVVCFVWIDTNDDERIVEIERAVDDVLAAMQATHQHTIDSGIGSWWRRFRAWTQSDGQIEIQRLRRAAEVQLLDAPAGRVTGELAAAVAQLSHTLQGQRAIVVFKDFLFMSDLGSDGVWQVLWRPLGIEELRAIEKDPSLAWDPDRLRMVLQGLDPALYTPSQPAVAPPISGRS